MSRSLKEKEKRREALERLQRDKNKNGLSRLDEHDFEVPDVFDLVDETEYTSIVESRRAKTEFVVDDDGAGYKDDGEEHLGIEEDPAEVRKRVLLEQMDREDSKSAKRLKKLTTSSTALPSQRDSMTRFLQPAGMMSKKEISSSVSQSHVAEALDVESLMRSVSGASKKPSVLAKAPRPLARRPALRTSLPSRMVRGQQDEDDSEHQHHHDDEAGDGDDHGQSMDTEENFFSSDAPNEANETSSAAAAVEAAPVVVKQSLTKTTKVFKRTTPALDTFKPDLDGMEFSQLGSQALGATGDHPDDSSFALGESVSSSTAAALQPINPSLWLQHADAEGDEPEEDFLHMYWLDATEVRGVVYLFGKVAITEEEEGRGGEKTKSTRYVSACVAVSGCERNLFVLPRATGETAANGSPVRASLAEVHQEISRILVPTIIPKSEGAGFRCKKVKRSYAFEHGDVPREETEYLKVVYSSRYASPSPAQCGGGQCIERIFGGSSSAVELFLLKRKLMGPCWIKVRSPKTIPEASWCKIEVGVESPKLISRVLEAMPPPTLLAMCISLKTAVNPATHVHELIAISCLTHNKVDVEADTDTAPRRFTSFTLVRPLGSSCGASYTPAFPHDLTPELSRLKTPINVLPNERALLNTFFQRLGLEDPDILSSHNLFGFEFDVIINRALHHKLGGTSWSKLGRLRRTVPPKGISDRDFTAGRVLCDTYKAAKEFLRETTYSLSHLSYSQLGLERKDVDPVDVPKYFSCSGDIIKLMLHTANDASLVMRLMLKLQVVPLTKQLTSFSGNLWTRTMRGARAERIEYLLLHEFHAAKYILPEKKAMESGGPGSGPGKKGARVSVGIPDGEEGDERGGAVGGHARSRAKAAYAGGLVLEPKKGLYDTYVLLLDFNSLYPSIIQEYNLCFTTINWTQYMPDPAATKGPNIATAAIKQEEGEEEAGDGDLVLEDNPAALDKKLAPLPDGSAANGILPRVIRNLVEKRKQVKALLKKEIDPARRLQYDIRQKALKLTANSMYGCLGFSFSRFYARPIAALVTAMGREALQRTVNLATNQMQLNVIYGDTDSVMIDSGSTDLVHVKEIGVAVRKEVNKLYKCLELDIDGIFKSMLLLKKKKYAAVTINERADGSVYFEKEMKGLDLVRRDWCPLSKEAGKVVVEEILSGKPREEIVETIHAFIIELTRRARAGEEDLSRFVVTKGLNKSPKDYPDCKGQAHLQVALKMMADNRPVNIGDHIPYVICKEGSETGALPAQRAHHPDEIRRSEGALTVDVEWYMENQILPPISRLCEPIEGTSVAILSAHMGLDAAKYAARFKEGDGDEDWGFQPKSKMDDSVRFARCERLLVTCSSCHKETPLPGVLNPATAHSGLDCTNCGSMFLGRNNANACYCYLSNRITLTVRSCVRRYYDAWLTCDDHTCGCRTKQQSVLGTNCVMRCNGRLSPEYDDETLHTQLKYFETLFNVQRYREKHPAANVDSIPLEHLEVYSLLKQHMSNMVQGSAYNWVLPSLWSSVFGGGLKQPTKREKVLASTAAVF